VLNYPDERDDIPETVLPLLTRNQVRTAALTQEEAVAIRDWAQTLPGWGEEPGLQLLEHPSQASRGWHDLSGAETVLPPPTLLGKGVE
jgi:hypothetical protein